MKQLNGNYDMTLTGIYIGETKTGKQAICFSGMVEGKGFESETSANQIDISEEINWSWVLSEGTGFRFHQLEKIAGCKVTPEMLVDGIDSFVGKNFKATIKTVPYDGGFSYEVNLAYGMKPTSLSKPDLLTTMRNLLIDSGYLTETAPKKTVSKPAAQTTKPIKVVDDEVGAVDLSVDDDDVPF